MYLLPLEKDMGDRSNNVSVICMEKSIKKGLQGVSVAIGEVYGGIPPTM